MGPLALAQSVLLARQEDLVIVMSFNSPFSPQNQGLSILENKKQLLQIIMDTVMTDTDHNGNPYDYHYYSQPHIAPMTLIPARPK